MLEATLLLSSTWLLVRLLPFRWWCRLLGKQYSGEEKGDELGGQGSTSQQRVVQQVCRAVEAVNHRFGGRFTCLMLAMAAHWMLGRRGIGSSLVLGTRVESSPGGKRLFKAHAWVRVGDWVVLGEHGGHFTAVSSFVRQGSKRGRVVKAV